MSGYFALLVSVFRLLAEREEAAVFGDLGEAARLLEDRDFIN
jgi:hypothetical protein